jgi:hypothetical protein
MMRQLFQIGLILLALSPPVLSQKQETRAKESNLYHRALYATLDKMNASWGGIKYANGEPGPIDYHNMIVQKNRDITEGLPSQLGVYHVEYLDSEGLIDRYKKLRKDFAILVAYPWTTKTGRDYESLSTLLDQLQETRVNFCLVRLEQGLFPLRL